MFTTSDTGTPATGFTYLGDGTAPISVQVATSTQQSDWDDDGHGTHVAGIIAALGNNGLGTAGVMWNGANLISYKVISSTELTTSGSGSDWAVYGSLYWLTLRWNLTSTNGENPNLTHTNQVTLPVNVSLGGYLASSFESDILGYALQNNVLVIAAMGNDGQTIPEFPAAYPGVIAVGATEGNDTKAPYSTTGSWIAVSAPGNDIVSTYNGSSSDYAYDSGTSMSTPFVTGLVAYMISQNPGLTPDQIKAILEDTADDVALSRNSNWSYLGAGRVNVKHALDEALGKNGYVTPAPGTVFSRVPLTVWVTNNANPVASAPVYLYDSTGAFVAAALTSSTTADFSTASTTGAVSGSVNFWLLKPGNYTVRASDSSGVSSGSATVVLPAGASSPVTVGVALK